MPSFLPPPNPNINYTANVFNLNPSANLRKWRKALQNVRAGLANARILCIGDSTTFGVGSNGSLTAGNMMPLCYPQLLANYLNAQGINAHADSYGGLGAGVTSAPNRNFNDGRYVFGSDFSFFTSANPTLGGCYATATADTGNPLTFTPTKNTDTCVVFSTNTGTSKMNANGGANSVLAGGSSATFSTTLGNNTYKLSWNAGGGIFNIGMSCYDSSKKWVDVMNAGWQGAHASDWDNVGTQAGINAVTPNLTIINLGINDWATAISAAWVTHMQQIITYALAQGDVILNCPAPSQITGGFTQAGMQSYITAMYGLAASNNIPLIDTFSRWISYAISNPLGYYFNSLHPIGLGYSDQAQQMVEVLASP